LNSPRHLKSNLFVFYNTMKVFAFALFLLVPTASALQVLHAEEVQNLDFPREQNLDVREANVDEDGEDSERRLHSYGGHRGCPVWCDWPLMIYICAAAHKTCR